MSSREVSSRPDSDALADNGSVRGLASPEQIRDDLIDSAAEAAPDIDDLIRLYYRHIPAEEILGDEPANLVGAVRSHLQLAQQRMPGRPVVRLLNPTKAEDGWTRDATVVQIVTDDMPYLVDSVAAEFARDGVRVQRIVHPIVVVNRELTGKLKEIHPVSDVASPPEGAVVESWMYIEIDTVSDPSRAKELDNRLTSVLSDVREVVEDTDKMAGTARQLADELEANPPPLSADEVTEGANLLRWFADGHFTFLGYRRYELRPDVPEDRHEEHPAEPQADLEARDEPAFRSVLASGLGVLRQDSLAARGLIAGPDSAAAEPTPNLLVLTQASAPSTVHRSIYPYYVGVKIFDKSGKVVGEHRFLGMFTSTALHENVLDIPVIAGRVREVIRRAGFPINSFSGQRMLEVLQNWPLADLFSADQDSLYGTATGAITLSDRRRLRLFLRRDPYGRFYSCLVFLPRDRYTTRSRLAMQDVLLEELEGTHLEYSTRVGETLLAQVHFVVHTDPSGELEPDILRIQDRLNAAVRSWDDLMVDAILAERRDRAGASGALLSGTAEESATELAQRFNSIFPEAYKEDYSAAEALADLRKLESLSANPSDNDLAMSFYLPEDAEPGERRFKLYLIGEGVTLSTVLPLLQNMGVEVVDERPYELWREDGVRSWIYDFGLRIDSRVLEEIESGTARDLQVRFQDAFEAAWRGKCEADGLNGLVLRGGLTWRQVAVLRAYSRYLRQTGSTYSQEYIQNALLAHTDIATGLLRLFEARFDTAREAAGREEHNRIQTAELSSMIDDVKSLDEDRILRRMMAVICATLRTNHYVTDENGQPRPYLAIKLDPKDVPDLPEPRPRFEIFVCSPRVEGVHLRFGAVARGGLRWSDRREDFRTEILGLVKAQAVKNAVIVPVGAKGGFVVKRPPAPTGDAGLDRDAYLNEGIACYRMFISGLLDLTDNLIDGETAPAADVVRHDGDDNYLVVAADKGTAKFSDIANEVAGNYGFWLGDAFASGGSIGYDHKAMGITAKGAWESVKRHFREFGVNTQTEDFTVVGIGDMAGDVFGNGMLLSNHIRLVAAFNHMHIFLDPNPDAATSFAERERLFNLPRSSWEDYDRSLISEGGGIYSRSAKTIPITPQVRAALGLGDKVAKLSPAELMRAILLAPVDLLWNGGIGTYVKAHTESHADAGDKANDALRVDGKQLRVKVVGEGGNLGLTQLGRIEFAHSGGKINTDALDNSAGVDCSDHEVNIKILLDHLVSTGKLEREQRNELLAQMTDEVGELVLADNYRQNAVLGISRAHAAPMVSVHQRLVNALEKSGALERHLESLPTNTEFKQLEKSGAGLTSPELATLLAHVKLDLKNELLASELPDVEVFARRLPEYFPQPLRERFGDAISEHPLRRQIITTLLVNEVVDGAGVSFAYRLNEEMNATATDAVRAFAIVTSVFDLPSLWASIDALDNKVPTDVADAMYLETRRLLDRAARWFLTHRPQPLAVGSEIARFGSNVAELLPKVGDFLLNREAESVQAKFDDLVGQGVPTDTAWRIAVLLETYGLLDITEAAELAEQEGAVNGERSAEETAALYYALADHLNIDKMLSSISQLERGSRWHALARLALRDDLYSSLRSITLDALKNSDPEDSTAEKIKHWEKTNASRLSRARVSLDEINRSGKLDLATLSVAARQIRSTVR